MRNVIKAEDAMNKDSKAMKIHSIQDVAGSGKYSAAADCKRLLEIDGGEGMKSVVKSEKREREKEGLKIGIGILEKNLKN